MADDWYDDDIKLINSLRGGGKDAYRRNPVMEDFFSAAQGTQQLFANKAKMEAFSEAQAEKNALKKALSGVDMSSGEGMGEAVNKVSAINPLMGLKLRQELTKGSTEERKAKTDALKSMVELNKLVLPNLANNPEGYIKHYQYMQTVAPEIAATMRPPESFMKNGQFDMQEYNKHYNEVAHGTMIMEAALKPTPAPHQRTRDLPGGKQQQEEWAKDPQTGQWGWHPTGQPAERWKESEGMTVTLADGTQVQVGGKKQDATGLTPAMQTKTQEGLNASLELQRSLTEVNQLFKPEYLTYGGQWGAFASKVKSKAGYKLNPEEDKFLSDFAAFRSSAAQTMVERLKAMSGVAISPQEYERNLLYIPNPGTGIFDGDSPQELRSKLDRFTKFTNRAVARLNYIRKHGFSIENIPLEQMDTIINKRAGILENQLKSQGLTGPNLTNKVKAQLAVEFGLVQ
jgi:hypothetical protein